MSKIFIIAAGGAIGTVLRFFVSKYAHVMAQGVFPWGTLTVNLIGCLLIGFLWSFSERASLSPNSSFFLFVGVLGAFTTFSTYSLESLKLLQNGQAVLGIANIGISNVVGLLAVWAGKTLGSRFLTWFI